jgi:hypothetical protein
MLTPWHAPNHPCTRPPAHKPLVCLQIAARTNTGGHHARHRLASIRPSQAYHNGSWRTLAVADPLLHPLLRVAANSRCTVCAWQNYLVEDCALFGWFRARLLARLRLPPLSLVFQHNCSICTSPASLNPGTAGLLLLHCTLSAPLRLDLLLPLKLQIKPNQNLALPHVIFDGQVINWTLLGIRHLSDCGSLFFSRTHRRAVYHYIKKMKKSF